MRVLVRRMMWQRRRTQGENVVSGGVGPSCEEYRVSVCRITWSKCGPDEKTLANLRPCGMLDEIEPGGKTACGSIFWRQITADF